MSEMEVMELVVTYRVPRDGVDDLIVELRHGMQVSEVAGGLACLDAFESGDTSDPDNAEIRALYKRARDSGSNGSEQNGELVKRAP